MTMSRQATEHKTANDRRDQSTEPMLANQDAEAALLGAMLIDNAVIDRVLELVRREDFFWTPHGDIFRAVMRLHANGEIASPVTLKPIFEGDIRLHPVGGVGYLAKLTGSGAGLIGAYDFAKQISSLATMRRSREALYASIEHLEDIRGDVWPDPMAIAAELDTKMREANGGRDPVKIRTLSGMTDTVLNRTKRAHNGAVGYHNAWISDFNAALGDLEQDTYNVLAGRPGMGKTVAAVSASLGYAASGNPWIYLHAEMSEEQMDLRVISDMAFALGHRIPIDRIRKGELTEGELVLIARIKEMAELMPIEFIAIGPCDVSMVGSHIRRASTKWKAKGRKLAGFTLDYLQLLTAESILGNVTDERRVANAVSKYIRKLINDEHLAGLILSQLTRKVEDRPRSIPILSDLRESGKIEEDADSVSLLWREEYYLERMEIPTKAKELEDHEAALGASRGKCELIVPKNRHGKSTKRTMRFHGDYQAMRGGDHTEYHAMFTKQHNLFEEGENVI
jgi:replicative DNA helicase